MSNFVCRTQQGRHNSLPLRKIFRVFLFPFYQKFCTFDITSQTKKFYSCQNRINVALRYFIKESSVLIRRDGNPPEMLEPRQPGPFPYPGSWASRGFPSGPACRVMGGGSGRWDETSLTHPSDPGQGRTRPSLLIVFSSLSPLNILKWRVLSTGHGPSLSS